MPLGFKHVEALKPSRKHGPGKVVKLPATGDALADFPDEASLQAAPSTARQPAPLAARGRRAVMTVAVSLLVIAGVGAAYWFQQRSAGAAPPTGSLSIQSEPAGAEVVVDGSRRGVTPLTISLSPGAHAVGVTSGANRKDLNVSVNAGQQTVHHVTWAQAEARPVPTSVGALMVTSSATGDIVLIDGAERGRTPLRLDNLAPGAHVVTVRSGGNTVRRTIDIVPGVTTSLVVTTAPGAGWLSVSTALPMQVREGGQIVGTTEVARMMLPPGDHELEFVAEAVGFSTRRTVRIAAGQGTTLDLPLPRAGVNINATPWAEVFIDGQRIGETPLANVQLALGPHEIVFRHPEHGERRVQTVTKLGENGRVSVDMRNQPRGSVP